MIVRLVRHDPTFGIVIVNVGLSKKELSKKKKNCQKRTLKRRTTMAHAGKGSHTQ